MSFMTFVILSIPRKEVVTKQTEGYSQQQQEEEEEILVFQVSQNITIVSHTSSRNHLKMREHHHPIPIIYICPHNR